MEILKSSRPPKSTTELSRHTGIKYNVILTKIWGGLRAQSQSFTSLSADVRQDKNGGFACSIYLMEHLMK